MMHTLWVRLILILTLTPAAAWARITSTSTQFSTVKKTKAHPYFLTVSTGASRGLGYYDDVWNLDTSVAAGWNLPNKHLLTAGLGFKSILYREYEGKVLDTYDSHPENYGPTDTDVVYRIPELIKNDRFVISSELDLFLPTSTISRNASLIAGLDAGATMDIEVTPNFSVSPDAGVIFRQYRYDDADVAGGKTNSPFAGYYGLSLSAGLWKSIIAVTRYGQTQRYDYLGDWSVIQTASLGIQGNISESVRLKAGYSWKDKTYTNEPAFAYDNTEISVGLSATIQ